MNQLIHNPHIEKIPSKDVMLDLVDLKKTYPTSEGDYVVLENLNLQIKKEEFITIVGHSGCGKTTLLSIIAGLNEISDGKVSVLGSKIKGTSPDRGIIFQSPSLMPWLNALENVMLSVKKAYPHATKKQKEDICKHYLHKVGMESYFYKKASDISQGDQQRIGIARAFATKPKILLLDEPFGMLDSLTRNQLQDVLIDIWNKEKITAVMVTHNIDEALFLSDRIAMMTSGPKANIGDILPIEFNRPRNRKTVLEHKDYDNYRKYIINFLEH